MVFGDLLNCLAEYISAAYGSSAWAHVARRAANLDASTRWLPSQPFEDSLFDSLAAAASSELQQTERSLLSGLGLCLVERMASDPRHARVVACLGSSFPELLAAGGLHFVHLHLDMYTRMLAAPGLHITQQSASGAVLRFRREGEGSACPGLSWVMVGAVKGVAHTFFNCAVTIEPLGRETGADGVEEELFTLTFPPATSPTGSQDGPTSTTSQVLLGPAHTTPSNANGTESKPTAASNSPGSADAGAGGTGAETAAGPHPGGPGEASGAGEAVGTSGAEFGGSPQERLMAVAAANSVFAPSRQLFYCMFPYHFIVDQQCRLVQVGPKLRDLLPSMKQGTPVAETFKFEYPPVMFSYPTMLQLRSTPVLLRVWNPAGGACSGLELMGEFLEVEAGPAAAAIAAAAAVARTAGPTEAAGAAEGTAGSGTGSGAGTSALAAAGLREAGQAVSRPGVGQPEGGAAAHRSGGEASTSGRCMLFMGSPRISGLEEMKKYKLSLADIPAFDMAREFMLLSDEYGLKMAQGAADFSNLRVEVHEGMTFTSSSSSGMRTTFASPPPWGLFTNRSFNRSSAPHIGGGFELGPNPFSIPYTQNISSAQFNPYDSSGPSLASMFSQGYPGGPVGGHNVPASPHRLHAGGGPSSGNISSFSSHPSAGAGGPGGPPGGPLHAAAPSHPSSGVGSGSGAVVSGGGAAVSGAHAMTDASLALGMAENSADKAIQLLDALLNGQQVSVAMIFEAREAMLGQASQRHPPQLQMREQLRFMGLDDDVNRSLLQLLDTDTHELLDDAADEGDADTDQLPDWAFDPSPPPSALPTSTLPGVGASVSRRASRAMREPSFTIDPMGGSATSLGPTAAVGGTGPLTRRRSSVEYVSSGQETYASFDGFAATSAFGSVVGPPVVPGATPAAQRYVRLSSGAMPRSGSTNSMYALAVAHSSSSGRLGEVTLGANASATSNTTANRDQGGLSKRLSDMQVPDGVILGTRDSAGPSAAAAPVAGTGSGAGAAGAGPSGLAGRGSAEGRRSVHAERLSSTRPSPSTSASPSPSTGAGANSSVGGGTEQPPWFLGTESSFNLSSVLMSQGGAAPSNLQSAYTGSTAGTSSAWPQATNSSGGGMTLVGSFNAAAVAAAVAADEAMAAVDNELTPPQRTNSRWASAAALTAELAQQLDPQLAISSGAHADAAHSAASQALPLVPTRSAGSGGLGPGEVLPLSLRQLLQASGQGASATAGPTADTRPELEMQGAHHSVVRRAATDGNQPDDHVWVGGSDGALRVRDGEVMTAPSNSADAPRFARGSLPGELLSQVQDRQGGQGQPRAGTARRRRMSTPLVPVISPEELRAILQRGGASNDQQSSVPPALAGTGEGEATGLGPSGGSGGAPAQVVQGQAAVLLSVTPPQPGAAAQVQWQGQAHNRVQEQWQGQALPALQARASTGSLYPSPPSISAALGTEPGSGQGPVPHSSGSTRPFTSPTDAQAAAPAPAPAPAAGHPVQPSSAASSSVSAEVERAVMELMRQTDALTVGAGHVAAPSSSFPATQSRLSYDQGAMSMSGALLVSSLEVWPSEHSRSPLARLYQTPADQLSALLSKVDEWRYNTFELAQATDGHALSVLGFALIKRCKAFRRYKMDETKLARYLIEVEAGYNGQHYHCSTHAADVLRSLHVLGTRGGVWQYSGCSEVSVLAMCLAAVIHDYGHKSLNNDFLIKTQHPLAVLYNDRSPMENHHVAAAWTLLKEERHNFVQSLPPKALESLRKVVIDVVLCTDMKQHFAMTGSFNSRVMAMKNAAAANPYDAAAPRTGETGRLTPLKAARSERMRLASMPSISVSQPTGPSSTSMLSSMPTIHPPPPASQPLHLPLAAALEQRDSNSGKPLVIVSGNSLAQRSGGSFGRDSGQEGGNSSSGGETLAWDEEDRLLVLQMALKCADLGHLTSPLDVHLQWVHRLEEEMFRQGDQERAHGLPVSPLMDRTKGPGITKSQTGFFNIVALPMYQTMALAFPNCNPMLSALKANLAYWMEKEAHAAHAMQHDASDEGGH